MFTEGGSQASGESGAGPAPADNAAVARALMAPHQAAVDAVEADIASVCGVLNAATGRLVGLIAQMLALESFASGGAHSAEQWVAWKCGVSPSRARGLVAMARRLGQPGELTATRVAFEAGELSGDQVAVVCRYAPAHIDNEVVELAKVATVTQLRRSLSRYGFNPPPPKESDPDEPVDPEPPDLTRVSFGFDDDGYWRLSALLGADQAALMETALAAARQSLMGEADDEASVTNKLAEDSRVTWADALVCMADRSLGAAAVSRPHHDGHLVLIHLQADDISGTSANLHLGPALPDVLRRYMTCDAQARPVITLNGKPFSVGRSQRIVPARTRMAIEQRDGGCRVPGCDRTRWLHIHHIEHWEDGGATDTSNLIALCSHHHRLHHQAKLGISGDGDRPDSMVFTDVRGRVLNPCGRPTLPARGQPLPQPTGTWVHPVGEQIRYGDVWFNEPGAA